MKYESEYMPEEVGEDKVYTLKNGKAVELDVPDDKEEPEDADYD